jgi:prepilin-type N-terminal cleavage/methylation domain-containing protein
MRSGLARALLFDWSLYSMNQLSSRGFSLVELAVTLVVLGLVLAFSIPSFQSFNTTQQLKGATENVAAQMRMMREVAISSGTTQTMHFFYANLGGDYHIHNGATVGAIWSLPRNIVYYWGAGTNSIMTATSDGRMSSSGMIILQDQNTKRDTVSVLASGLVLTK